MNRLRRKDPEQDCRALDSQLTRGQPEENPSGYFVSIVPCVKAVKNKMKEENKIRKNTAESIDFKKKRHSLRSFLSLPVEYFRSEISAKQLAHTADISEGGLTLYVSERFEIGQNLHLKLFFSYDSNSYVLKIKGQVVSVNVQKEGGEEHYRAGVQFADISTEDTNRLKSFLNYLNQEVRVKASVGKPLTHPHRAAKCEKLGLTQALFDRARLCYQFVAGLFSSGG